MRWLIPVLILILLFPLSLTAQHQIEPAFPKLSFTRPVDLQHPGDESGRLFVVEQDGRILVFPNDPDVTEARLFLDIRDRVNDSGNEEGLLGLAFHPSYKSNGYFYVNYTAANPRRTVVARYRVSAADPDVADPATERVLLTIAQPYSNHNGGQVGFGPDGYLYISTGDGGSGGDPQNNAQNRASLLGKILRIDVDNPRSGQNYGIPVDNPFTGNTAGHAEEIWAYGLRNPWRFSFDPVTERLWTGDVGQNRYEEVDIIEPGRNYGWRIMEGFACYNPASGCDQAGLTKPIVEYGRDDGASITGGHVYRGPGVPALAGTYIYADFVTGKIWGLSYDSPTEFTNELLLNSGKNISAFGVDEQRELYLCSFDGSIYRFTPSVTNGSAAPVVPLRPELHNAYPNPAVRGTHADVSLRFAVPAKQSVRLILYDTLGRAVRTIANGEFDAGIHRLRVDIATLPAGIYFTALHIGRERLTRKLVILE
ncbi:MAG: PQQ-dependent sugar dehydrogenase [Bacteroidota bacterium]|jgi:glucose/arabinose dehydrogenase|nr:PQQ-dependent sugar dehydrogenase [Bacteroidota bacterium]